MARTASARRSQLLAAVLSLQQAEILQGLENPTDKPSLWFLCIELYMLEFNKEEPCRTLFASTGLPMLGE